MDVTNIINRAFAKLPQPFMLVNDFIVVKEEVDINLRPNLKINNDTIPQPPDYVTVEIEFTKHEDDHGFKVWKFTKMTPDLSKM